MPDALTSSTSASAPLRLDVRWVDETNTNNSGVPKAVSEAMFLSRTFHMLEQGHVIDPDSQQVGQIACVLLTSVTSKVNVGSMCVEGGWDDTSYDR